jgi:hypothetical protein
MVAGLDILYRYTDLSGCLIVEGEDNLIPLG